MRSWRGSALPKLLHREQKTLMARLVELTRDAPCEVWGHAVSSGAEYQGLSGWAAGCACVRVDDEDAERWRRRRRRSGEERRRGVSSAAIAKEFRKAVEFLWLVRCFLHYRHERDDNTLDWQAQDAAAEAAVGLTGRKPKKADAAYWMRVYFRHARSVERRVKQMLEEVPDGEARRRSCWG